VVAVAVAHPRRREHPTRARLGERAPAPQRRQRGGDVLADAVALGQARAVGGARQPRAQLARPRVGREPGVVIGRDADAVVGDDGEDQARVRAVELAAAAGVAQRL
jgi:hypothetical protein